MPDIMSEIISGILMSRQRLFTQPERWRATPPADFGAETHA